MAPELVETWSEAQARKIRERVELEAERHEIGVKVNALAARKAELEQAIKMGNRQRQDVSEFRAELAALLPALQDADEQYKGVGTDLKLITGDAVDGLAALLERHRPELQEIARQKSAEEAELLHAMVDNFARWKAAREVSTHAWREAWAIGPNHPGHRADELGNARVPGGSAFDVVALTLKHAFGGARNGPAGATWVDPILVLSDVLEQMADWTCLPAAAVTDPRAGSEGLYRRCHDGQPVSVDELGLRRQYGQDVAGEDGFALLRYAGPLSVGNRQALENDRAVHETWSRGERDLNPINGRPGDAPAFNEQPADQAAAPPAARDGGLVRLGGGGSPLAPAGELERLAELADVPITRQVLHPDGSWGTETI